MQPHNSLPPLACMVSRMPYMVRMSTAGMVNGPLCSGVCQKYAVPKQPGKGRYGLGHARCQICSVWVDAKGACLKDGSIATAGSVGWYCRCCHYRLRTTPRSIKYKSRLETVSRVGTDTGDVGSFPIDLSYFNRHRAGLLQRLAAVLPEGRDDVDKSGDGHLPVDVIRDLRYEFSDMGALLDLAYNIDPPNKISMVVEFERVKSNLNKVPTKKEFEKISVLRVSSYDHEFGSWENFLDKMGHDPWYRRGSAADGVDIQRRQSWTSQGSDADSNVYDYVDRDGLDDVAALREQIRGILEHDADARRIFEMMEADIGDIDPYVLRSLADEIESD